MTLVPQSRLPSLRNALITGFVLSPLVMALQQVHASDAASQLSQNPTPDIATNYVPLSALDAPSRQAFLKERPYCSGVWLQPNQSDNKDSIDSDIPVTHAGTSTDGNSPIIATADSAYFSPDNIGKLYGNVKVVQGSKTVNAEQIDIDLNTNIATAKGDIAISNGDIYSETKELNYDLSTKNSKVTQSQFFSEKRQAHGTASNIEQSQAGILSLDDVSYSTCPPARQTDNGKTKPKSWEIQAKNIKLDDNKGRGYAKNARLIVLGIPTLYLPYINFPIDDRRMSGLLIPKFGFSNSGGLDFSLPYYLNLAPNYDMTLTPRILFGRGGMLEGEFRYLFDGYGETRITGGLLPNDNDYAGKDREYLQATHQWLISRRFKSSAEFNYVSDKDYFNDLSTNPLLQDELNLPRNIILDYTDDKRELEGQLKVEGFQTVDNTLPDSDKPYSRLPQLTVNYNKGSPTGIMSDLALDFGYFKKRIDDGSAEEESGSRYYGKLGLSYNWTRPWGYIKPAISVEHLLTMFDETTQAKKNASLSSQDSVSLTLPSFTVDGGLIFESDRSDYFGIPGITQTIEPRFFFSYAPYKNQRDLPNFDTTTASLSYDQLFTNQRFLGRDRLPDSNALSLGINYRIFDDTGLERFSIGLGNKFNFNNQQVQITGEQAKIPDTSGPIARIQGNLTPNLSLSSDIAYQDNGKENFQITQLSWQPQPDTLVNLGYSNREVNPTDNQQPLTQATASIIAPITDRWKVMAHGQYDLNIDKSRDILVGANYESCCYRLALYGRHYYNNLDNPLTADAQRQVMLEVSFKGLAGLSGGLSNLLDQKVLGYARFNQADTLNRDVDYKRLY